MSIYTPADEPFEIRFVNRDTGVEHNVSIYKDEFHEEAFFVGEFILGDGFRRLPRAGAGGGLYLSSAATSIPS